VMATIQQPTEAGAPPSQTLYLSNLNEKLKLPELKKSLYELFSQFGPILEVVASKGVRLRGQAWVVFRDLESANAAKRKLHDAIFFDKAIQIEYAKAKSDVVAKTDGTFVRRAKRATTEVNRLADPEMREAKKRMLAAKNKGSGASTTLATPLGDSTAPPNKLLFVQNLPPETTEMMLAMLFRQYPGFVEVRLVPGKTDIAFVEFGDESQASVAKEGLNGFKIVPDQATHISYAKRG